VERGGERGEERDERGECGVERGVERDERGERGGERGVERDERGERGVERGVERDERGERGGERGVERDERGERGGERGVERDERGERGLCPHVRQADSTHQGRHEGQAQEGQAQEGQAQEGQAQEGQAQEGQAQEGCMTMNASDRNAVDVSALDTLIERINLAKTFEAGARITPDALAATGELLKLTKALAQFYLEHQAALQSPAPDQDDDEFDLMGCEACGKNFDYEKMHRHGDVYLCDDCHSESLKEFETCEHDWSPHQNSDGDDGRICSKCHFWMLDPTPSPDQGEDRDVALNEYALEKARDGGQLLKLLEDHYWDSLEPHKEIILFHIRSVFSLMEPME